MTCNYYQGVTVVSSIPEKAMKDCAEICGLLSAELKSSTDHYTITLVLNPAYEDAAVHCLSHRQTLEAVLQSNSLKVPSF